MNIMKKKMCKLLALAMAGIMTAGCLSGCGPKEKTNEGNAATDIEISVWYGGNGIEWIEQLIKAFNEKYPKYNAYYTTASSNAAQLAAWGMEDVDTTDLYFAFKEYDVDHMESLNDVLDTKVEGESKSIKEKFEQDYLTMEEYEGNYYNLPWGGGITGYIYNKALFEQAGIEQTPRTTNELAFVCGTLSDKGITPMCHFQPAGYYEYIDDVWFSQYNGFDYYIDFHRNPSKEKMLAKDGRYEAIKAQEKIVTPEYIMTGSNSESHIAAQTKFLEGKAAMMLNGTWITTEMKNTDKLDQFAMMKTPVISAITDKLTTVKTEKDLRKLITAIDNVTDGVETVDTYKSGDNYKVEDLIISAADWQYVKEARNSLFTNFSGFGSFIPKYSNAKEGAKDFLRFMYSDEGYQIYLDVLEMRLPLNLDSGELDVSGWSKFNQNLAEVHSTAEHEISPEIMSRHKAFSDGGADTFAFVLFERFMCVRNEADRRNAEDIWKEITGIIDSKYDTWMKNVE